MEKQRHFSTLVFLVVVICDLAIAIASDASTYLVVEVDRVWTGTNSQFASLTAGRQAFIAYYNARRKFNVAQIDLASGALNWKELPARATGWDSHDETKIALDKDNKLHVVFVDHSKPLEYFRSPTPFSISDISSASMTGRNEGRVTYPSFVNIGTDLFFVFRDGVSGDGAWYANVLREERWKRLSDGPIFASKMQTVSVSAYPSSFIKGKDEQINAAIVWRKTPDVNSNFRLSFVKSRDFTSWARADGSQVVGVVDPNNSDVVDDVGEGRGLVNNAQLSLTKNDTPIIVYTKYDGALKNGLYLAYYRGAWETLKLAASSGGVEISGRGSLSRLPNFSPAVIINGLGSVHVKFPDQAASDITFDAHALGLADTNSDHAPAFKFPEISTGGLSQPVVLSSLAKPYPPHDYDVVFRWVTQGPHSDLPRPCTSSEVEACNPRPAKLTAFIFQH